MTFYVAQKLAYDPDFSEVLGVFSTPELAISAAKAALENKFTGEYVFKRETDKSIKIFSAKNITDYKFMVFPSTLDVPRPIEPF